MKVLVVGPEYFNYTSSVTWGVSELGHQVVELTYRNFIEDCSYVEKKMNKIGFKAFEQHYYQEWNQRLIALYHQSCPDICLVLNGKHIFPQTLELFRKNNSKLILWLIDSITRMPEIEKTLAFYDKVVSFEHRDEQYLHEKYRMKCSYSPVGYDSRIYYPDDSVIRDIDISFVGSAVPKRIEILQHVATYAQRNNRKLATFSKFWDSKYFWKKNRFAKKNDPLHLYVHNGNISPQQVAQIYRRSKICLNIHIPEHEGVNPRTFEIMGTKSFELVDKKPKMSELVKVGRDVIEYEDVNDLINKIEYYLNNDLLRETIALKAYKIVKEKYTITQVVQSIMY